MTAERRLARVEASLSPTELVLRWLDEAHAFGDLESYVRSLLDDPAAEAPMDRLVREAETATTAGMRGRRGEDVRRAVLAALRETVFRFELVLRINVTAHELLERQALIDAALAGRIGVLSMERAADRRPDPRHADQMATYRDLLVGRVAELRAAQAARTTVEERYLAGRTVLFPADWEAWAGQLLRSETLADVAVRFAEMQGVPPPEPPQPDAASPRSAELVADLVEPAKATALEKLGEGERALGIATRWLRDRHEPVRTRA